MEDTPGSKISTEKKKASQKDIYSFFYVLDLRRERKEDYMKVGESNTGTGLQESKITCFAEGG